MAIEELLEVGRETDYLDYKAKIDFKGNRIELLKDVMAFANNDYVGNQYIVYGVQEQNADFEPVGLSKTDYGDDATYQELISKKIEPYIEIEFIKEKYNDMIFLVLSINADKNKRPYMIKNKYSSNGHHLSVGGARIRIGSLKRELTRNDIEKIYNERISPIEVSLRDKHLSIINQNPAKLEMIVNNPSDIDRIFTNVFLAIYDERGKRLTILSMDKFVTQQYVQEGTFDSDFALSIPPKKKLLGVGEFSFTSSQAIAVKLNKDGEGLNSYIFELKFRNEDNKDYNYKFSNCSIFGSGKVLWKIKKMIK